MNLHETGTYTKGRREGREGVGGEDDPHNVDTLTSHHLTTTQTADCKRRGCGRRRGGELRNLKVLERLGADTGET